MKKRGLPITASPDNFQSLTQNLFVDKSRFIQHVLDSETKSIVISRPRRWGKSLNLNMLKEFLETTYDYKNEFEIGRNYELFRRKYNQKPLNLDAENIIDWQLLCQVLKRDLNSLINSDLDFGFYAWRLSKTTYKEWGKLKSRILTAYIQQKAFQEDEQKVIGNILIKHFATGFEDLLSLANKEEDVQEAVNAWKISKSEEEQEAYKKIDQFFGLMGRNCGSYPVIFLNFQSYQEEISTPPEKFILNAIQEAYEDHESIEELLILRAEESQKRKKNRNQSELLSAFQSGLAGNFAHEEDSLKNLIDILYDFHGGRKVWILIDEYDAVLNHITNETTFQRVQNILGSILQEALKDNSKVEKSLLIGILNYAKGGMLSGLNNFFEFNVVNDYYFYQDFGFTEEEVQYLFSQVLAPMKDMNQKHLLMKNIKDWYNGYIINDETLYNPFSIMCCLQKAKNNPSIDSIQAYWIKSGSNRLLETCFKKLTKHTLYRQLLNEAQMTLNLKNVYEISQFGSDEKVFWTIALHSGYLTRVKDQKDQFKVPNFEVKKYFIDTISKQWVTKAFITDLSQLIDKFNSSLNDLTDFKAFINNDLLPNLSPGARNESDLHTLLGGIALLVSLCENATYTVFSDVSAFCEKYIDNIFYPRKEENVIIHEYKEIGYDSSRISSMEDAFWQILANLYIQKPLELLDQNQNWKEITIRGLIFYQLPNNNRWMVDIHEYTFPIEKAREIYQIFFNYEDREELVSSIKSTRIKSRIRLLQANKSTSLDSLIKAVINSNENYSNDQLSPLKKKMPSVSISSDNRMIQETKEQTAIRISRKRKVEEGNPLELLEGCCAKMLKISFRSPSRKPNKKKSPLPSKNPKKKESPLPSKSPKKSKSPSSSISPKKKKLRPKGLQKNKKFTI